MTLYLVRHGKAGTGADPDRPLTDGGSRQAEDIATLLADAGVGRVLTSRYVRCVQTVSPLADRLGVELEVHPALAEEADVDDAWDLIESLAAHDVVLCSHGNILSPVLDRVLRRGAEIEGEWACRKGSVWRLDCQGDLPFTRAVLAYG